MRGPRPARQRLAFALAVLALVLAGAVGCAGTTTGSPTATTVADDAPITLAIDEPDGGSVAAIIVGRRLHATVIVEGRAPANDTLNVASQCPADACSTGASVSADGHWSARILATASPSRPVTRITATVGSEIAITTVRLRDASPQRVSPAEAKAKAKAKAKAEAKADASTADDLSFVAPAPAGSPPQTATTTTTTPPAAAGGPTSSLLLVGDSLGVGIAPALPGLLPGWTVAIDARESRSLAEGMARWRPRAGSTAVAAFSLFTNDDPSAVDRLQAAVEETISGQGNGCAVWATIVRPAVGGVTYAAANALLARLAAQVPRHLILVPWAAEVAAHPEWLAGDGVHATAAGYAARAQLYAQAARSCPG